MKKLLSSFALALCLAVSSTASAAVQEFGPDFARFTLDVPAGWTATPVDGGVQVVNAAKDTSLAVMATKNGGADAKTLAEGIAKQSGYASPSIEKQDDTTYLITGQINGADVATVVSTEDDALLVITMAGKDMDGVEKIVDSLADK